MKSLGLKLHSEPLRRLCQTRGAGLKSGQAKRFRERCPLPGHQTEGERRRLKSTRLSLTSLDKERARSLLRKCFALGSLVRGLSASTRETCNVSAILAMAA